MIGEYSEIDIQDTLRDLRIPYRERGQELQATKCPFCEQDRQRPSDHFSIRRDTGQYHCVKCEAHGNLFTLRKEMGLEPMFQEKKIRSIDQSKVAVYQKQEPSYYQKFEQARGIPADIVKKYGVGMADDARLGKCRTYPFVDPETGDTVNVKYVNARKEFKQEKDAQRIYYGLQFVDFAKDTLHVVEGEDDCMAIAAMGIENVVSIPNGAKAYNEEMGKINSRFKKIFLLFDVDQDGEAGAKAFAQKAGYYKCWRVKLPFKDARECLRNGLDLFDIEQYKNQATQYEYSPDDRLRPALSLHERLSRYERECRTNKTGMRFELYAIDRITEGLRPGEVFTFVANPGAFKTTSLMNMLLRGAKQLTHGIVIFFSLEMQIESEVERELQIEHRQPTYDLREWARNNDENWNALKTVCTEGAHNKLFVSEESYISIEELVQIVKTTEQAAGEQCKLIGIDYLDFLKSKHRNEYDAVRENMNAIKARLARALAVPVIVLAQTNRESRNADAEIGMRSGKGGTGLESASDFMVGIWLDVDSVVGRFTKHRRMSSVYTGEAHPYLTFEIDKKNYRLENIAFRGSNQEKEVKPHYASDI